MPYITQFIDNIVTYTYTKVLTMHTIKLHQNEYF